MIRTLSEALRPSAGSGPIGVSRLSGARVDPPRVKSSRTRALAGLTTALAAPISLLALSAAPASAATTVPAFSLRPYVNCVWTNPDSSRTVSLGYQSFNAASVTVPAGVDNKISYGAADQGQPTTFLPGSHDNVFVLTMTSAEYQSGSWYLVSATANLTSNGTPCTTKPVSASAGSPIVFLGTTAVATLVGVGMLTRRRGPRTSAATAGS